MIFCFHFSYHKNKILDNIQSLFSVVEYKWHINKLKRCIDYNSFQHKISESCLHSYSLHTNSLGKCKNPLCLCSAAS